MSEPNPNRFYKWTIEIEVNEVWVADGFEVTAENIQEMLQERIGFAHDNETRCRVVKSPSVNSIRKAQGYEHASWNMIEALQLLRAKGFTGPIEIRTCLSDNTVDG